MLRHKNRKRKIRNIAADTLSSHGQHNPESRSSADHLIVGLGSLLEWIALNHGSNAAERTEFQRVFGVFGGAGGPALDGLAASNHLWRSDCERLHASSHNQ